MKCWLFYIFFLHILSLLSGYELFAIERKVVFIILDGIPADVLISAKTPYLDSISGIGAFGYSYVGGIKDTYSESPTISAVGYNHLLTGTWSNKHNVYTNGIEAPNYNYPSVFKIAKDAKPDIETAVFSTWTDNRTKLIGDGLKDHPKIDYVFDGYELDTIKFLHSDKEYIFKIDEKVSEEAAKCIAENGPDLSWVYLEYTDDIGHHYGDGEKMTEAVRNADIQVGRIWKSIKIRQKQFNEDWLIIVTTDHGRNPINGRSHGHQSERERTSWIITNLSARNDHFNNDMAMVDILPSMLRFMEIKIPESIAWELDGVPFTGAVSMSTPRLIKEKKAATLIWNSYESAGKVEIYYSPTNHYQTGSKDEYVLLGAVPLTAGNFKLSQEIAGNESGKILLKAGSNTTNIWLK